MKQKYCTKLYIIYISFQYQHDKKNLISDFSNKKLEHSKKCEVKDTLHSSKAEYHPMMEY